MLPTLQMEINSVRYHNCLQKNTFFFWRLIDKLFSLYYALRFNSELFLETMHKSLNVLYVTKNAVECSIHSSQPCFY